MVLAGSAVPHWADTSSFCGAVRLMLSTGAVFGMDQPVELMALENSSATPWASTAPCCPAATQVTWASIRHAWLARSAPASAVAVLVSIWLPNFRRIVRLFAPVVVL